MALYRVVLKSGANMDVVASAIIDEAHSEDIYFFKDESRLQVLASVKREHVAGVIFLPEKFGKHS
jgi:hypothetical protein